MHTLTELDGQCHKKIANQLQTQRRSWVMGMCARWSGQAQCYRYIHRNVH